MSLGRGERIRHPPQTNGAAEHKQADEDRRQSDQQAKGQDLTRHRHESRPTKGHSNAKQ
ncbi:MAG: hypothetical protein AAGB00_00205 [Planctomycetota bacterium]